MQALYTPETSEAKKILAQESISVKSEREIERGGRREGISCKHLTPEL